MPVELSILPVPLHHIPCHIVLSMFFSSCWFFYHCIPSFIVASLPFWLHYHTYIVHVFHVFLPSFSAWFWFFFFFYIVRFHRSRYTWLIVSGSFWFYIYIVPSLVPYLVLSIYMSMPFFSTVPSGSTRYHSSIVTYHVLVRFSFHRFSGSWASSVEFCQFITYLHTYSSVDTWWVQLHLSCQSIPLQFHTFVTSSLQFFYILVRYIVPFTWLHSSSIVTWLIEVLIPVLSILSITIVDLEFYTTVRYKSIWLHTYSSTSDLSIDSVDLPVLILHQFCRVLYLQDDP